MEEINLPFVLLRLQQPMQNSNRTKVMSQSAQQQQQSSSRFGLGLLAVVRLRACAREHNLISRNLLPPLIIAVSSRSSVNISTHL